MDRAINPEIVELLNKYRALIRKPDCGTVEQQEAAVDTLDAILATLQKDSSASCGKEWEWTKIGPSDPSRPQCGNSFRMSVPGGWLVRSDIQVCDPYDKNLKITSTVIFVQIYNSAKDGGSSGPPTVIMAPPGPIFNR